MPLKTAGDTGFHPWPALLPVDKRTPMPKSIRRVVTGHNGRGQSVFIMDGPSPHVFGQGTGSVVVTELWETRGCPADNRGNADAIDRPFRLPPPGNGSAFRIIEYPPDKQRLPALARERQSAHYASTRSAQPGAVRHPGFHKTDTVDYVIVLSGEIHALMDEGEVLLKPGDVLIQRGTSHAWSNRTDEPAYLAFVLIDADPV